MIKHAHPTESIYWRELHSDDPRRRWPTLDFAVWCPTERKVILDPKHHVPGWKDAGCQSRYVWSNGGPGEWHEHRELYHRLAPSEDPKRPYKRLPAPKFSRKKPRHTGRRRGWRGIAWRICVTCWEIVYE